MAEDCPVVRFSRDPSLARIDNLKQLSNSDNNSPPDKYQCDNNMYNVGVFYIICIALSIITYILDLLLACILLYYYSIYGYGVYFALTLSFILVPAILMTTISLRWYIVDHDDPSIGRTSLIHWIMRIIFLLLQLSPLLRYIETLIYGIKCKIITIPGTRQIILYRKMLDEDTNGALLRLFHCFLHSAPQALIQLMILLIHVTHNNKPPLDTNLKVIQGWTVVVGLVSVAWALTSYHRSIRFARDDKEKIQWAGTMVLFLWHLMSALSRILALSLLASIFPAWMGFICALHWGVMSIWLALGQQQTSSCGNRCEELLLSMALGLAYVLAFISPRDGPTRYIYLAYYLVCLMENIGALVVWCVTNNSSDNPILYYGAVVVQLIAFLLAIAFLFIYYKYCHPTRTLNHTKIPDNSDNDIDKPSFSKSYNVRTSYS